MPAVARSEHYKNIARFLANFTAPWFGVERPLHVTRRKKCALFFPRKEVMPFAIRRGATTVAWMFSIRRFR
jgi:hypothetical protein